MNYIKHILGKDISSIIFTYLTIHKENVKNNYNRNLTRLNDIIKFTNYYSRFDLRNIMHLDFVVSHYD
jgi:hypothetical protein